MTGLTLYRSDEGKRLELLREIAPTAVAAGRASSTNGGTAARRTAIPSADVLEQIAREQFGFEVEYFQVDSLEDARKRLPRTREARGDGRLVCAAHAARFRPSRGGRPRASATCESPPIYSLSHVHASSGGLVSYQSVFEDPFASWAKMLALILDGFPAGEIPIERPQAFELAVNVKAAREQGIAIPKSILLRATNFY